MTQKPENQVLDEVLVDAFLAGDLPDSALSADKRQAGQTALDTLCRRYYEQVYYYLLKESLIKEASFIEDIRQEVFLTVFKLLKSRRFIPRGKGSFRAWFYTTAQNICWNCNYQRGRGAKPIYGKLLELIPAKSMLSPDEAVDKKARLKARLARVLAKLSPQEMKLMTLLNNEGKTYEQIHQEPEFVKYSLDYLMRKVYIIRKKIHKAKDSG